MRKMDSTDLHKKLRKNVQFRLEIVDGFLYIQTPIERYRVNDRQLRYDGVRRNIMEYLINTKPGCDVTINEIRETAKIPTSQDLRRLAWHVGLTNVLRYMFIPTLKKDLINVATNITVPKHQAVFIIEELRRISFK